MKIEEYNRAYDQLQRINAAIYGDRRYDEKPGITNVPLMVAETFEVVLGDGIEKVQYPALLVEPTDILEKYGKLLAYVRGHMDSEDLFDRLLASMLETAVMVFGHEQFDDMYAYDVRGVEMED